MNSVTGGALMAGEIAVSHLKEAMNMKYIAATG